MYLIAGDGELRPGNILVSAVELDLGGRRMDCGPPGGFCVSLAAWEQDGP